VTRPKLVEEPKAPQPRCEFTPKQRHDVYKAFLKLHATLSDIHCGKEKGEQLCSLHRAALAAIAPMVQVLAGGDGNAVMKLMALHRDSSPGITMPNLMLKVAAALAEGTNGHGG
jgi:hypothetical protein